MRWTVFGALLAGVLAAMLVAGPATAWTNLYEVHGVSDDDMLKMRAGAGTGFVVVLGLPNGTLVHVESCQLIGGTNWCKVALEQARAYRGYVSMTYLREKK